MIPIHKMSKTILLLILSACMACASHKSKERRDIYEISDSVTLKLNHTDSVKVNDLRFSPASGPTALQRFMFNKFGQWDSSMESDNKFEYLIWTDVKLFEDNEELFSVAIGGDARELETIKINGKQEYAEISYCSAIVFDSKGRDCFRASSDVRDLLVEYFMEGADSVK